MREHGPKTPWDPCHCRSVWGWHSCPPFAFATDVQLYEQCASRPDSGWPSGLVQRVGPDVILPRVPTSPKMGNSSNTTIVARDHPCGVAAGAVGRRPAASCSLAWRNSNDLETARAGSRPASHRLAVWWVRHRNDCDLKLHGTSQCDPGSGSRKKPTPGSHVPSASWSPAGGIRPRVGFRRDL